MAFSEKGYHVAVSTEDGFIAIWDLRKQKKVATITCDDDNNSVFATALSFDPVGKYLAFGTSGGKIVVTAVKDWNKHILEDGEKKKKCGKVTGLVWGMDAQALVTSREDHSIVKFWGASTLG